MSFNQPFGPPPPPDGGASFLTAGTALGIGSMALTAVGSFYAATADRYQLRSQELAAEFQASLAAINQRVAEQDAAKAIEDGQREAVLAGLEAKAARGTVQAQQAASGFATGQGSNAEAQASMAWAAEADQNAIVLNSFRRARAARTAATNYGAQRGSLLASARNMATTRRIINPAMQAAGGLFAGGSRLFPSS